MRVLLLYDNLRATNDAIKLLFMEAYELFIKVRVRIIVYDMCLTQLFQI